MQTRPDLRPGEFEVELLESGWEQDAATPKKVGSGRKEDGT